MPDLAVISLPVISFPSPFSLKKMLATSGAISNIIRLMVRSEWLEIARQEGKHVSMDRDSIIICDAVNEKCFGALCLHKGSRIVKSDLKIFRTVVLCGLTGGRR